MNVETAEYVQVEIVKEMDKTEECTAEETVSVVNVAMARLRETERVRESCSPSVSAPSLSPPAPVPANPKKHGEKAVHYSVKCKFDCGFTHEYQEALCYQHWTKHSHLEP